MTQLLVSAGQQAREPQRMNRRSAISSSLLCIERCVCEKVMLRDEPARENTISELSKLDKNYLIVTTLLEIVIQFLKRPKSFGRIR